MCLHTNILWYARMSLFQCHYHILYIKYRPTITVSIFQLHLTYKSKLTLTKTRFGSSNYVILGVLEGYLRIRSLETKTYNRKLLKPIGRCISQPYLTLWLICIIIIFITLIRQKCTLILRKLLQLLHSKVFAVAFEKTRNVQG